MCRIFKNIHSDFANVLRKHFRMGKHGYYLGCVNMCIQFKKSERHRLEMLQPHFQNSRLAYLHCYNIVHRQQPLKVTRTICLMDHRF